MNMLSSFKLRWLVLTLTGVAIPPLVAGCTSECYREVYCVKKCGDPPEDYGCGICPSDMIDTIDCTDGG